MMSIIIFLIILAILVLVHEFGHFIVAKKSGIRVDEFGLGFPPRLFGKKWGGTLYSLNIIPFGGFVKIFGEDPHAESIEPSQRKVSFYYKPKIIQAAVLVAGVAYNILFAWLLISFGFFTGVPSSQGYSPFGEISNPKLTVTDIAPGSPAEKAGILPGDAIERVSSSRSVLMGEELTAENIKILVENSPGQVSVIISRGSNSARTVNLNPEESVSLGRKFIGISMDTIGTLKLSFFNSFLEGARTTFFITEATVLGLLGFLWNIFTLHSDFSQVAGPVGIAGVVKQASTLGFSYLVSLVALISINLAVINLLPFPALDGGRLLFVFIEAIIKRPISSKVVRYSNTIGFVVLIILMVAVTTHDILKLL